MEKSLIAAFKSMLTLQRWNLHPKVETWVEAENAAMVTHLAYAIAKQSKLDQKKCLTHLLIRTLLKSLNKHYMTDISLFVKNELKNNKVMWKKIVDGYADKTAKLFPRDISITMRGYLTDEAGYGSLSSIDRYHFQQLDKGEVDKIENIIRFCQIQVAIQECQINSAIYGDYYKEIIEESYKSLRKIDGYSEYNQISGIDIPKAKNKAKEIEKNTRKFKNYLQTISRLKYIRRWNTVNRLVPSSVLAHTYIVAVLSLMFSLSESEKLAAQNPTGDYVYSALLRALFHDVSESLTGDIVTPVKKEIESHDESPDKKVISEIEKKLSEEFLKNAPQNVQTEITYDPFLKGVDNKLPGKVSSLVKDCDRLASMIECLYDKKTQAKTSEMEESYCEQYQELSNSEWSSVRRFLSVISERWLNPDD